jgi:hypothetical protein
MTQMKGIRMHFVEAGTGAPVLSDWMLVMDNIPTNAEVAGAIGFPFSTARTSPS